MPHTPAAAMTDVASAPSPPLLISAASSLSFGASSASRLLYKDSLQTIFAFLPVIDLRSANSVSQQWHAAVASTRQAEALRVARLTAQIRSGLLSSDPEEQVSAVKALRTINRRHKDLRAFWPLLTEPAVVSGLIALLSHPNAFVATHCALALGNVAHVQSYHARLVVDLGAIPPLVQLLGLKHAAVQDNAMFCLANVSSGSTQLRDQVIAAGTLAHMLTIKADAPVTVLRSAAVLLRELCGGRPRPPWAAVSSALPLLVQLLQSDDEKVLTRSSGALVCLSNDHTPGNQQIQAILDCGAAPRIIALLGYSSADVRTNVLNALGDLVSGSVAQTQTVLDAGLAVALRPLVMTGSRAERLAALFAISNVVADTPAQIQFVVDAGLIPPIIAQLTTGESDVRQEAAVCVAICLHVGSDEQIALVVALGALPPLASFLPGCTDPPTVRACLDGFEQLLRVGAEAAAAMRHSTNLYATALQAYGARETIAALQSHHDDTIAALAAELMSNFH